MDTCLDPDEGQITSYSDNGCTWRKAVEEEDINLSVEWKHSGSGEIVLTSWEIKRWGWLPKRMDGR